MTAKQTAMDKRIHEMTRKLRVTTKRGHFGTKVKRSELNSTIKKLGE